jgi:hypothetical protein
LSFLSTTHSSLLFLIFFLSDFLSFRNKNVARLLMRMCDYATGFADLVTAKAELLKALKVAGALKDSTLVRCLFLFLFRCLLN